MLFDFTHWYEVLQSLRRNRLRTVLTACGVFWGVFMLVIMLAFGRGLEGAATRDFANWAQNSLMVRSDEAVLPFRGRQPGREPRLVLDDALAVARVPGVELALPRNQVGGRWAASQVARKNKRQGFAISGEEPEYLKLEALALRQGRFINPLDTAERRKVAVIGSLVVQELFEPDEDPIGQAINIGSTEFVVIGVHENPTAGGRGEWLNGRVFIPRTTLVRLFGLGNRVNQIAVLVAPDHSSLEVEAAIQALLRQRHAIHPADPGGIETHNREKEFRKFQQLFLGIAVLTWVVGGLTLLAGAIGVSNIMMIAVAERTREIGVRKAIGATPASIMLQILTEATVLTGLAGYLGLVAGVAVTELAARIFEALPPSEGPRFFTKPELDLGKAIAAAALLTISGALAGLAPARSAVAVRPVEALAHE